MSLATFKKKVINRYSTATTRSGKPPGGKWLPQGPFGRDGTVNSVMLKEGGAWGGEGEVGFSLNGSHRMIPVAKDMKFSRQGTRYRGVYPMGHGGHGGQYFQAIPVMNAGRGVVEVKGNQWQYVKPSVLSTRGMLVQKYRWAYSGQFPNYWVQPIYTGNQVETVSQGMYVHTLSAENDCVVDVNNQAMYEGHVVKCGPCNCRRTPAHGYKMVVQQANAPYTKTLHIPQDSSQHTLRIQRKCANPSPAQKPFPYAVNTGVGIMHGGTRIATSASICGTGGAGGCGTGAVYTEPPEWYTAA